MNAVPSADHVWTHDGPDATLYVSQYLLMSSVLVLQD